MEQELNVERASYRLRRIAQQAAAASGNPSALLDIETVGAMVGLRRSAIYKRVSESRFPAPTRLSARCSRWRASSIIEWCDAQHRAGGGGHG